MNARLCSLLLSTSLACAAEQSAPDAPMPSGSEGAAPGGGICPSCVPEGLGGDTGDFGGTPTMCGALSTPLPIDAASATALGFDVAEMERRLARPIDEELGWRISRYGVPEAGGEATGYSPSTRLRVQLSSSKTYRLLRPDPARCDGTTCRSGGTEFPQAKCPIYIETDVTAQIETADGAVRATLQGAAFFAIAGSDGEGEHFATRVAVNARARLSDATGSLRLHPRAGADEYRTSLRFGALLEATASSGELSPSVMITRGAATSYYHPLSGSFPPTTPTSNFDAGARRP